jgi:hypothetical protein
MPVRINLQKAIVRPLFQAVVKDTAEYQGDIVPSWTNETSIAGMSSLMLVTNCNYLGNEFSIPLTMAGVEIDTDSDKFQVWYQALTNFPPVAIFESQHKISEILNKYNKKIK